ncbi:alpha-L-fucosidase [Ningiella sp. W23]|uniref:alpha-L-fucosidase n=1 Tax=Ningiella sp. W23 TaxID=3023715 RepID=UPI003757469A
MNEVIIDLAKTIGDGGNYLINLGPKPDGTFDEVQAQIIRDMGKWVKAHAKGIYGTRAGAFISEGAYTSTQKGDSSFLFVFDPSNSQSIPLGDYDVSDVKDAEGNSIDFSIQSGDLLLAEAMQNIPAMPVVMFELLHK